MIEAYKLITASLVDDFENRIKGHLQAGYQPYGPPIVVEMQFVQAMVFDPDRRAQESDDE